MSEEAFNQLRKPTYTGMTDCVNHSVEISIEQVKCPCGRIDEVAYFDCAIKGRIKAVLCRMFCGEYEQRNNKDKK